MEDINCMVDTHGKDVIYVYYGKEVASITGTNIYRDL